ncbi:hypothetical protein HY419_00970 [candidate division WWE3 bacterium]|nr:hypothetical protein [candidate division WWE3 bacterium]
MLNGYNPTSNFKGGGSMKTVAISISVGTKPFNELVLACERVVREQGFQPLVVLAAHKDHDPKGTIAALELQEQMPNLVTAAIAEGQGTRSGAYLLGFQVGSEKADSVIGMDVGAHNPEQIADFLEALRDHDVVLASRHIPGARNLYPLQRRLVSRLGTLLPNLMLSERGCQLTDFTSGFEGFRSEVLRTIFERYPPKEWISVTHGPFHLQNTELRFVVRAAGYNITEIPIIYGERKEGKALKLSYLLKSLMGFLLLVKKRKEIIQKVR